MVDNIKTFIDLVRQPEFGDQLLCSICAIRCGAEWQHNDEWNFAAGKCPCCDRDAPLTMVKRWKWPEV